MKAYLNGIELGADAADLEAVKLTYTGRAKKNYADRVEFSGWAYDLLKAELIDDEKGYLKSVPFRLDRTCCGGGTAFLGAVRGDKIDWDSDGCIITASIIQQDDESEFLRKLESTLIADHLPNTNPMIFAFSGRGLAGAVLTIIINFVLIGFLQVLRPVVATISVLVSVFDRGAFDTAMEFMDTFVFNLKENGLRALGQKMAAPLVRELIEGSLSACGLTFQSSILNEASSAYFNLAYLAAQQKPYSFSSKKLIKENIPLRSVKQFLDELKQVFDADYDVYGDVLIFERRDLLPDAALFDITQETDLSLSYSWEAEQKNAYFDLRYTIDIDEKGGNSEAESFNHIEEWNEDNNDNQSGAFEVNLPFSPYVLDFPFNSSGVKNILTNFASLAGQPIPPGKHLEISGQYVYVPKLLPLVQNGESWTVSETDALKGEALYDNFYFIENPRESGFRGMRFTATFIASCSFIENANGISRVIIPFGNNTTKAYVNNIEIDFNTNQARVSGEF